MGNQGRYLTGDQAYLRQKVWGQMKINNVLDPALYIDAPDQDAIARATASSNSGIIADMVVDAPCKPFPSNPVDDRVVEHKTLARLNVSVGRGSRQFKI